MWYGRRPNGILTCLKDVFYSKVSPNCSYGIRSCSSDLVVLNKKHRLKIQNHIQTDNGTSKTC